jgi:hypothetical protein
MYGEYKTNSDTQVQCWSPAQRERKSTQTKERTYSNNLMDTFSRNEQGRITSYRYGRTDATYSIGYDSNGDVNSICSSDGRVWSRTVDGDFSGWLVRSYFERWYVADKDCGDVFVTEQGIAANGTKADMLGLPERPDRG